MVDYAPSQSKASQTSKRLSYDPNCPYIYARSHTCSISTSPCSFRDHSHCDVFSRELQRTVAGARPGEEATLSRVC